MAEKGGGRAVGVVYKGGDDLTARAADETEIVEGAGVVHSELGGAGEFDAVVGEAGEVGGSRVVLERAEVGDVEVASERFKGGGIGGGRGWGGGGVRSRGREEGSARYEGAAGAGEVVVGRGGGAWWRGEGGSGVGGREKG